MKANIETLEPVIRPTTAGTRPVRQPVRAPRFIALRPEAALFHAWRA